MVRRGDTEMGRVNADMQIVNRGDKISAQRGHLPPDQVRSTNSNGIVDTGAAMLVIPESIAQQLGFPVVGQTTVRYADHRTASRDLVEDVEVEILGRRASFQAVVEPSRKEPLIGAIVLEALDLLVDCRTNQLQPRDPNTMITEIE